MHPILNVAMMAAREAGDIIMKYAQDVDRLEITEKDRNNYVTQVDQLAERAIIKTIKKYYPDHAILGEETGHNQADSPIQWIIDPLDGTTNYLHQFPQYSISIAVTEKGNLQHGVVFDPLRDEMFSASKGQGAKLNNRRIRVTEQKHLTNTLLATGFPYYQFDYIDDYLATLKFFMSETAGIRRAGSAALDLAYVACGRVDGYWEFNLKPWDIAAGILLVQEAGGRCCDFAGGNNQLVSGNILAGNPKLLKHLALGISQHIRPELKR
ncbi:inositol monophosphatase family protein [Thiomicrospira sp. ALE5]|uniref:inositol monophosphatase family protein n=1 Tax=Thiomicrospira sp. ALE5 TaxID=748650 RepID=UPI0008F097CE|nr:inositol monophosphatase family protein [Thiomicrospira sp. ALE5]SFR63127.1 myo-inositol-1(or 4)-monophosphatase [Thiomicrospira sp. ALE5]